jgi:hypothetical protein
MTDLQIGLLVLGAAAVAAVLIYNRVQERATRKSAERAFAAHYADVLQEPHVRREPTLATAAAGPDERIDYVMELKPPRPVPATVVHEAWRPVELRFGRRALIAEGEGGGWRAALQLVTRAGVVSEAELIEFRTEVETVGTKIGAAVSAPEMRGALEAARELDRTCADSDIQVALHVIGENISADLGAQPFQVVRREDGVTLVLDVALTPDLARSYEAMARAGHSLATAHGGRLVDDRGNALDDRALASIGAQLEAVRQTLAGRGIETGSPLALRLFS